MLEKISLRTKLASGFIIIGIISITLVTVISFISTKNLLITQSLNSLSSITETKKQLVENYFSEIKDQIIIFSSDPSVIEASKEFFSAFSAIEENQFSNFKEIDKTLKEYYQTNFVDILNKNTQENKTVADFYTDISARTKILQYFYIVKNPHPLGKKYELTESSMGNSYDTVHKKYHGQFDQYFNRFKYYDIFIVNAKTGDIVYSYFKELDFATNLFTGHYKNTQLGLVFKNSLTLPTKDASLVSKLAPYDPSYGAAAGFVASPIYDKDEMIGTLIFQFPIDKINELMISDKKWKDVGLGQTGESYLVDLEDKTMRSDSRLFLENKNQYFTQFERIFDDKKILDKIKLYGTTIFWQPVSGISIKKLLDGEIGTTFDTNYLSIPVVSSFAPLKIADFSWGIITQINQKEISTSTNKLLWNSILWSFVIIALLLLLAFLFVKISTKNLLKLTHGYETTITKNAVDLTRTMDIHSGDELEESATHFNTIIKKVHEVISSMTQSAQKSLSILSKLLPSLESLTKLKKEYDAQYGNLKTAFTTIENDHQELTMQIPVLVKNTTQISQLMNSNQELITQITHTKESLYHSITAIKESFIQEKIKRESYNFVIQELQSLHQKHKKTDVIQEKAGASITLIKTIINILRNEQPKPALLQSLLDPLYAIRSNNETISQHIFEQTTVLNNEQEKIKNGALVLQKTIEVMQNNSYSLAQLEKEINSFFSLIEQLEQALISLKKLLETIENSNENTQTLTQEMETSLAAIQKNSDELYTFAHHQKQFLKEMSRSLHELNTLQEQIQAQLQMFKI